MTTYVKCFLAFGSILLAMACAEIETPKQATVSTPEQSVEAEKEYLSIDLATLPKDILPAAEIITVQYDHSLKTTKQYEAYPFLPVWHWLIEQHQLDTATTQIVFECKDGYLAPNTLQELLAAGGGYLAFRDLEALDGEAWPESLSAKYAPFYLVWKDIPADDHHLAWPYGLVKLRIFKKDPYASLRPDNRPELVAAFDNYRLHCIKCHSLNKIGGDMGPEFNVPRNITDYWKRNDIVAYIQNPKSFRYNSKMYPITSLSEKECHAIVDYLEWVKR